MTNLEALKKLEGVELIDLLDEFTDVPDGTEEWLNKEYIDPNRMITIEEAAKIMRQQWDYYCSGHHDIDPRILQANIMAQRSLEAWSILSPEIYADRAVAKIRECLDFICEPIKWGDIT